MESSRDAKLKDRMNFYHTFFHFNAPHHIILDVSFVFATIASEIANIDEHLGAVLDAKCRVFVTPCVLEELEQNATQSLLVKDIVRNLDVYPCLHPRGGASSKDSECIIQIASQNQFKKCLGRPKRKRIRSQEELTEARVLVGTQDGQLLSKLRKVPGVPVIYLENGKLIMDKPSKLTWKWVEALRLRKMEHLTIETEILKRALSHEDDLDQSKRQEASGESRGEERGLIMPYKKRRDLSPDICDVPVSVPCLLDQQHEKLTNEKVKFEKYKSLINAEEIVGNKCSRKGKKKQTN